MKDTQENKLKKIDEQNLENIAGGDILDDLACEILGHDWKLVSEQYQRGRRILTYKCSRCGVHKTEHI